MGLCQRLPQLSPKGARHARLALPLQQLSTTLRPRRKTPNQPHRREQRPWQRQLGIAAALLSAHAHDPKLIDPIRAEHARIRAQAEDDGSPPGNAHIVVAAADGLFLAKVFGLWTPSPEQAVAIECVMRLLADR
jgi:hypothetical protein